MKAVSTNPSRRKAGLGDALPVFLGHWDVHVYLLPCLAMLGLTAWLQPGPSGLLWFLAGWLVFLPQEYLSHVFILHVPFRKEWKGTWFYRLLYRMHYGHHDHPKRFDLMFIPLWLTLPLAAANGIAFRMLFQDPFTLMMLMSGLFAGYLFFEWSHLFCHLPYQPRTRIGKRIRNRHAWHHHRNETRWFSVSWPALPFDSLGGTEGRTDTVPVSPSARFLGLDETDPRIAACRSRFAHQSSGTLECSRLWLSQGVAKDRQADYRGAGADSGEDSGAGHETEPEAETETATRALSTIRRGWAVDAAEKDGLLRLAQPQGGRFSLWAAGHFAVWAGCLVAIPFVGHPLLLAAIAIVMANQLHALTILQHDCGHGSAYRSKALNLWVGRFLSFFIFLPYSAFQEVHKWHHWFLGDPERDPDEWYYAGGPRQLWFREMLFMPYFILVPLVRYGAEVRNRVLRELFAHMVLWSLSVGILWWAGRYDMLLWGVLLPMAGLAFIISPISRGYEHYPLAGMPRGHKDRLDLHKNSVTITGRIYGFLWVNITYHVEHHLFPRIPFFALPEAHRIIGKSNDYLTAAFPLQSLKAQSGSTAPYNDTDADSTPTGHSAFQKEVAQ